MAPTSDRRKNHLDSDDDEPSQDDFDLDYFDTESDDHAALEKKLARANLPEHVRKITTKELLKLRRMPPHMPEYAVIRNYLELMAELPWNACTPEIIDLAKVRNDLDRDHYGLDKLKERVVQYLAVRKLRSTGAPGPTQQSSSQPILCFVGPPGTGKTSLARSIAMSLNRNFQRISLGGVSDQSDIRGHRRTYIGSMPGRIVQGMKQAGSCNPVILLDEIDKMGYGHHGDPAAALLEVLDPEQNHAFIDHYVNIPYDLSKVMFVATANSTYNLPSALYDRMETINVHGYTHDEKLEIAKRHLIPKQIHQNGLSSPTLSLLSQNFKNSHMHSPLSSFNTTFNSNFAGTAVQNLHNHNLNTSNFVTKSDEIIVFKDDAIEALITRYAREAGVRNLERNIAAVCRVVAVKVIEAITKGHLQELPIIVTADSLIDLIGPRVWDEDKHDRMCVPGVAIGLAWTPVGGEIMYVETQLIPGNSPSDALVLTGQLGSVMRESSKLSISWLRANCSHYTMLPENLANDLTEQTVHIHFPAGAVGKEGPSAGVTIVTALISLFSGIEIKQNLAMTGEITLRGLVLPVGGIKTKVLAAHRAGIKTVVLPRKNQADLADVPVSVKQAIDFHFVDTIDEVIAVAFEGRIKRRPGHSTQSSNSNSTVDNKDRPTPLLSKL